MRPATSQGYSCPRCGCPIALEPPREPPDTSWLEMETIGMSWKQTVMIIGGVLLAAVFVTAMLYLAVTGVKP